MKKRLLSWLLVLSMVISLIPSTLVSTAFAADAAGNGVDIRTAAPLEDGKAEITTGGIYTIGATRKGALKVNTKAAVTLVLDNVTITTATSPIELVDGANVTLVVKDDTTNALTCTATGADTSNGGKTAGILVPKSASLTIDRAVGETGTGTLTVTGGYGGAGIGGGAGVGYNYERVPTPASANGQNGADSTGDVHHIIDWTQINQAYSKTSSGGTGGQGGENGYNGTSGVSAGFVTVNAGTVTVTGGNGGAGIGGGQGAVGGYGGNGRNGNPGLAGDMVDSDGKVFPKYGGWYRIGYIASGGGGGGGGGAAGNGGTGGAAGNGGTVTINGGSVTATAGDGAADIGGGLSGRGGDAPTTGATGAAGGLRKQRYVYFRTPNNVSEGHYLASGYGGTGGQGQGGYTGASGRGGDGGILNIRGGTLVLTHKTFGATEPPARDTSNDPTSSVSGNSGTTSAQETELWWPHRGDGSGWNGCRGYMEGKYSNSPAAWVYDFADGGRGGDGGRATKPADAVKGTPGILVITEESNKAVDWSDFVTENGNLKIVRPQDVYGNALYCYTLTVQDKSGNPVPNATVSVRDVKGANGAIHDWTVSTNNHGVAYLWLPTGNYTLKDKDVYHASKGQLAKNDSHIISITGTTDAGKGTVTLTPNVKLSAPTNKVYISGDGEKPVTVTIDGSSVEGVTFDSVKWFAVPISSETQYGEGQGATSFQTGYDTAGTSDKGEITVGTDKTWTFTTGQNGRYWVEVNMSQGGATTNFVGSIDVTNIYRKFPILVNSYTLNNGKKSDETGYQPLKTAAGMNYNANYGFPWDLNGYTQGNIQPANLLKDPPLGWDTVSIFALSSKVKWNTAAFGNLMTDMPMNASQSGYEPHKLTLSDTFLVNNLDADNPNDPNGPTKFTIVYQPRGGAVTDIAVEKVIDGKVHETNMVSYNDTISEETLVAGSIPGYKVSQVLIYRGNTSENGTLIEQDGKQAVKITNIHGTKDDPENTKIKKVQFIYTKEDGYTVSIVLKEQGTDADITDLAVNLVNPVTADKGQSITVNAPSIPNYKLVGGQTSQTLTAAELEATGGTTTVIFYYQKAEADLITITVKGVTVDGAAGEKQLYSFSKNERKSTTEVVLDVLVQEGYRVKSVTPDGGAPIAGTVLPDGSMEYKLAPGGKNRTVTVVYEDNMADVTVNAYYVGTTDKVDGFTPFKVKAEIGKPYTYGPLTLDGHDWDGITPALTVVPAQGGELNYFFTRKSGNVTYQLVKADDPNQVLITRTESVDKGDVVHTDASHAPKLENWTLQDPHENGNITGADIDGKYDGLTPVTVTYKAVPKTNTIEITRFDADTNAQIPLTAAEVDEGKSLTLTKETGHVYTILKENYRPDGYAISGSTKAEVYVPDDGNPVQVNLYYRNQAVENVTVKLVCGDADTVFQTFQLRRTPGTELLVDIPNLEDKGYKIRAGQTSPVTVPATETEVSLKYDLITYEVNVTLRDDTNSQDITLNDPSFQSSYTVRKSESLTVTAPSIKGYTLVSDLAVTKTADQIAGGDKTITFHYQKTTASEFVTHTLVLVDQSVTPNAELARYTSLVEKKTDGSETIYYAPAWDGYQVDAPSKKASNAQNDTVTFYYTKSAATITIHFVDTRGTPITVDGDTKKVLTGYEKKQTVMVAAPNVTNMALAGQWNATQNNVTPMAGVTATVDIGDNANVDVTFAYKPLETFKFYLKDSTGNVIKTVTGGVGTKFSTAVGENLDLSDSGWTFNSQNDSNTPPFNQENAELTPAVGTTTTDYNLYYTRNQRNVTYVYSDVTDPGAPVSITWTDGSNPATADVGSQLIAVAPQIPGYTPVKLRYSIPVGTGTDAVEVTFAYTKKQTGKVTVEHVVLNDDGSVRKTILSYVSSGSLGEWFKAEALTTDGNGLTADKMYKFVPSENNKATQTVQIGAAQQKICFVYEANYATVKTSTSVDGTSEVYQNGIEVAKNTGTADIPALTLAPPSKNGYLLKGITVTHGTDTTGPEATYPAWWSATTNTLGLYGLTDDV